MQRTIDNTSSSKGGFRCTIIKTSMMTRLNIIAQDN